jgi:hypothetical protein
MHFEKMPKRYCLGWQQEAQDYHQTLGQKQLARLWFCLTFMRVRHTNSEWSRMGGRNRGDPWIDSAQSDPDQGYLAFWYLHR